MAEIYEALEKTRAGERLGRFDMTRRTDDPETRPHAVGYCAGWPGDWTSGDPEKDEAVIVSAYQGRPNYEAFLRREEPLRAKYHRDGHATAEEAEECRFQFEMDHDLRFHEEPQTYRPCLECQILTTARAALQNCTRVHSVPLCPAHHQDREALAKHLRRR